MSVKERVTEFIKYKKLSVRKFESLCGLSFGYINNMRVSIQPGKITNIARQFPELNTGWLLTGEGEMLKTLKEEPIPGLAREPGECYESKPNTVEEKNKIITILWQKLEEKDKMIADLLAQLKEKEKEPCQACAQKDKEIENLKQLALKQVEEWGMVCRGQVGIGKKKKNAG